MSGKQIYLIRGKEEGPEASTSATGYSGFCSRIRAVIDALQADPTVTRLSYTITEERPPALSIIPFGKSKIACISIHAEQDQLYTEVAGQQGYVGCYRVEEALPVFYKKDWEGKKTPGICLLTLFRKKKSLDRLTFLDRWHNGHTPLSLKIHPLWHYSRNVVTEQESEEFFDGIVEEHTRTDQELLNPFKFFGNPLVIVPNMLRVYFDVRGFLDYGSVQPYLTREYIIN